MKRDDYDYYMDRIRALDSAIDNQEIEEDLKGPLKAKRKELWNELTKLLDEDPTGIIEG